MATPPRQSLPKAKQGWGCGSAGRCPIRQYLPKAKRLGTPRRCPFLNTAGDVCTVGSSNARNTPPFSSLRVLSYRFPSESVLGSIQSGVSGVSGFCVPRFGSRFPLKLPSGYPVPKYHGPQGSLACWPSVPWQGSPKFFPPNSKAQLAPPIQSNPGGFPPFRSAPSEEGA